MKKLLTLLLIAPLLFVACGDDNEEDEKPYFNPVEGEWVYTTPMGNTETMIFTKEFERTSISVFNGKPGTTHYGKYTIDATTIKQVETGYRYTYAISEDTLHMKSLGVDWEKKYIKKK